MQNLNYPHLSFRELLAQRKLAERAVKRNSNCEEVRQIIVKINKELDDRREIKFRNASKSIPTLDFDN